MKMFLDTATHNKPVTVEDLKRLLVENVEMGPCEVLELVDVDDNGDLHFAVAAYGLCY